MDRSISDGLNVLFLGGSMPQGNLEHSVRDRNVRLIVPCPRTEVLRGPIPFPPIDRVAIEVIRAVPANGPFFVACCGQGTRVLGCLRNSRCDHHENRKADGGNSIHLDVWLWQTDWESADMQGRSVDIIGGRPTRGMEHRRHCYGVFHFAKRDLSNESSFELVCAFRERETCGKLFIQKVGIHAVV